MHRYEKNPDIRVQLYILFNNTDMHVVVKVASPVLPSPHCELPLKPIRSKNRIQEVADND